MEMMNDHHLVVEMETSSALEVEETVLTAEMEISWALEAGETVLAS